MLCVCVCVCDCVSCDRCCVCVCVCMYVLSVFHFRGIEYEPTDSSSWTLVDSVAFDASISSSDSFKSKLNLNIYIRSLFLI